MAKKTSILVSILADNRELKATVTDSESLLSGFASKAAVGLAGAGVAGAAVFVQGFTDGLDQQRLASKFGDDVVTASADIYSDAWGESLEEVATQYAETARAFGDVDNLDALTESAFILAEKFDGDVSTAMQDAAELAESFGIAGQDAFDLLAVGLDGSTAEVRDELSAAIREYGGFFDGLGVSAADTLALLADFGEGGALALDKSADALKELTIRGTDMSAASVEAYEAAGLSADDMAAALLAGGDDAAQALDQIADGLLGIDDPTERAAAAIALFGAPLEDLGVNNIPGFLEALGGMGDGLGETAGATAALGEELGNNLGTKIESFKRQGLQALADLMVTHVIPATERVVAIIEEHWPAIRARVVEVSERIGAVIERVWPRVVEVVTAAIETVSAIVDRVTAIISAIWEAWGDRITATVERVWGYIEDYYAAVFDVLEGLFDTFRALFEGDWSAMWDGILKVLGGIADAIMAAAGALWEGVKLAASLAWDGIKRLVSTAVAELPGLLWAAVQLLYDAGLGLMKQAANGMAQALREAASATGDWLIGLPATLWRLVRSGAVSLFDFGKDLFDTLADGILEALSAIPGMIVDKVLGPLDEIAGKVAGLLGTGTSERFGALAAEAEASVSDEQRLLDAVVAARDGAVPAVLHDGGRVTSAMAQGLPGMRPNEVLALLEVGEEVIPAHGAGGGGITIGTLIVPDNRSLHDELTLQLALRGVA